LKISGPTVHYGGYERSCTTYWPHRALLKRVVLNIFSTLIQRHVNLYVIEKKNSGPKLKISGLRTNYKIILNGVIVFSYPKGYLIAWFAGDGIVFSERHPRLSFPPPSRRSPSLLFPKNHGHIPWPTSARLSITLPAGAPLPFSFATTMTPGSVLVRVGLPPWSHHVSLPILNLFISVLGSVPMLSKWTLELSAIDHL
jgi:hypothetical protein